MRISKWSFMGFVGQLVFRVEGGIVVSHEQTTTRSFSSRETQESTPNRPLDPLNVLPKQSSVPSEAPTIMSSAPHNLTMAASTILQELADENSTKISNQTKTPNPPPSRSSPMPHSSQPSLSPTMVVSRQPSKASSYLSQSPATDASIMPTMTYLSKTPNTASTTMSASPSRSSIQSSHSSASPQIIDPSPSLVPITAQNTLSADINVTLEEVLGIMDFEGIKLFEQTALSIVRNQFSQLASFNVDFLFLLVEGQLFQYDKNRTQGGKYVGDLMVFFQIVATVLPAPPNGFDFQSSMESLFVIHQTKLDDELRTKDLTFHSDGIEGNGNIQNTVDKEDDNKTLADYFTTTVVVGIALAIVAILLIGVFVVNRYMWQDEEEQELESPGRLGAMPSYDSEDKILGQSSSVSNDPSLNDPRSAFLSLSQWAEMEKLPKTPQTCASVAGAKSVGSVNNSSTNGSYLAGLDLFSLTSSDSKMGSQSNMVLTNPGMVEPTCGAIRARTTNMLDDLESESYDTSQDFIEAQWDDSSTTSLSISINHTYSGESLARQRKRKLEKRLLDSKRKTMCHGMQTLLENEALNEDSRMTCFSMKELIVPSTEGNMVEVLKHPCQVYPSSPIDRSSRTESPNRPKASMSASELFQLAERIPVEGTATKSTKKLYERMSDVSGKIIADESNVEVTESHEVEDDANNDQHEIRADTETNTPAEKSAKRNSLHRMGKIFNAATSTSSGRPDNARKGGGGWRLFGRNKPDASWDQDGDNVPISPKKRYGRGERGQLVPRYFARMQSDDETCQHASSRDSRDDEDTYRQSSQTGLVQSRIQQTIVDSHAMLGMTPSKPRPSMLDLRDLGESSDQCNVEYQSKDDEIETPLVLHPFSSDLESHHLTYGRDMMYGQDPDGFELTTTTHTRCRTIDIENPRIASIKQTAHYKKAKNGDPPTAVEHRRIRSSSHTTMKTRQKSSLRTKDSPRRKGATRGGVSFRDEAIEFAVNNDTVILGSMDESDNHVELEWGSMI